MAFQVACRQFVVRAVRKEILFFFSFLFFSQLNGTLLVDPSVGTVTVLYDDSASHSGEVTTGRSLGFTGSFFGTSKTTVDVPVSGNLNFSANSDDSTTPLPNATAFIAPFWGLTFSIVMGQGGTITESVSPGVYYAVTWDNVQEAADDLIRATCQVVWFGATTTIGGCTFRANDIVFSYGTVNDGFRNAVAGLNKGDSSTFSSIPTTADGSVPDTGTSSYLTTSYFCFRASGGTYSVSTGCPASTPTTYTGSIRALSNKDLYQTDLYTALTWSAAAEDVGAVSYRVYRNGVLIGTTNSSTLSYQDHNLRPSTNYSYQVFAVDNSGTTTDIVTLTTQTLAN